MTDPVDSLISSDPRGPDQTGTGNLANQGLLRFPGGEQSRLCQEFSFFNRSIHSTTQAAMIFPDSY